MTQIVNVPLCELKYNAAPFAPRVYSTGWISSTFRMDP